jgi:transcription antitermination factor NusG
LIWFPIRVSAGAFRNMHSSARTRLEHALKDYEFYVPWEWYTYKHHRTKKNITAKKPLIPGYCFIRDVTDFGRLEQIREIAGPIRGLDNRPRTISALEIERLQQAEAMIMAATGKTAKEVRDAKYPAGKKITIGRDHVFSGREARILMATGRETVKAVLEGMFGADVEIEIPVELIERQAAE